MSDLNMRELMQRNSSPVDSSIGEDSGFAENFMKEPDTGLFVMRQVLPPWVLPTGEVRRATQVERHWAWGVCLSVDTEEWVPQFVVPAGEANESDEIVHEADGFVQVADDSLSRAMLPWATYHLNRLLSSELSEDQYAKVLSSVMDNVASQVVAVLRTQTPSGASVSMKYGGKTLVFNLQCLSKRSVPNAKLGRFVKVGTEYWISAFDKNEEARRNGTERVGRFNTRRARNVRRGW